MNSFNVNNYSSFNTPYSYYNGSYSAPYWQGQQVYYTEPENNGVDNAAKTVGLAAMLQALAIGIQKGSQWFAKKLEAGKEFTSSENVHKIANSMIKRNNLKVTVDYITPQNRERYASNPALYNELDAVAKGQNAFYADQYKLAVAPKSKPSLILHELGHATNTKNPILKLLQKSRRYAVYAPMALLLASKVIGKPQDGDKNFIERNAGVLGFAAFLPTIIEEGAASLKGINAVKHVPRNLLEGALNTNILKRNYLCALATYILAGVGLGIASKQTIIENS